MTKTFKIPSERIKPLITSIGGCYASDRIVVDGAPVGRMDREQSDNPHDSGWRFFAGDEDDAYCEDPSRFGFYDVNTVCNYDPEIIPLLDTAPPCAFIRAPSGHFVSDGQFDDSE